MTMRDVQAAIEAGTVPLVPMPLKVADQKATDHMRTLLRFYTEMAQNDPKQEDYWQRCRLKAARALAPYETPRLQAVLVEAPDPRRELARKSDVELLQELQAQAAAVGIRVTIEPMSKPPQLTVGDGGKQDEGA
jgi:2-polyprenyl-6-methoxyphenol hydroxylase-like FAD-dependent oxidoreductase